MPRSLSAPQGATNRLLAVLLHIPFYATEGQSRLAADTGLSRSTISRLCNQKARPSYRVATAVIQALTRRSGRALRTSEVFSVNGTYPTPSSCSLMGCAGCLPPEAWDEGTDTLKAEWRHQKPGEWSRPQASPIPPAVIS